MIASMLKLSRTDFKALNLKDTYSLHKIIYSLFPPSSGHGRDFLFVDKGGDWNSRHILILSARQPLVPQYGEIVSKTISHDFLQFPNYGFEVVLNPTKRDIRTGKIKPIIGRENLLEWFTQKAPGLGFEVLPRSLQVNHIGVLKYDKDRSPRTHNTAAFIGKLKVLNRQVFIQSFEQGIGRAKGFGFGLLQIVPLDVNDLILNSK